MHGRTILLSIAALLTFGAAHGENISQTALENRIDDIIDAYYSMSDQTGENANEEVFAMLREKLEERLNNKIVINGNKRLKEELESLQFLSALQIDAICGYIESNGKMDDLNELFLVDGMYRQDVLNLMPFVATGKAENGAEPTNKKPLKNALKQGRHEIALRGDNSPEASEPSQFYSAAYYKFRYSNRISAGFNAEKDAGEQFWGKRNKGFDSYHAYVQIDNDIWLKRVVLGNMTATFGRGLVMNSAFSLGFSSEVNSVGTTDIGVKRSSSISEQNLLQGVGATLNFGKVDISAFYSIKDIDASLSDSSTFATINTSGLHRTESELKKKGTVLMQTAGANITFAHKDLRLGATAVCVWFDHKMAPADKLYTAFYFRGWEQVAASVDYSYTWRHVYISGETAISGDNALATINSIDFKPLSFLKLTVMHRYYSEKYNAIMSNSLAEGGRVNNEQGLYIGAAFSPLPGLRMSAFADFFSYPWAKYGIDMPSNGYNTFTKIELYPSRRVSTALSFRLKRTEHNLPQKYFAKTPVTQHIDHQNRMTLRADVSMNWMHGRLQCKPSVEVNSFNYDTQDRTWGYSVRTDMNYSLKSLPLSLNSRIAYFKALDYNNRFYAYESDVLYAFSSAMMYGEGLRYYVCAKARINKCTNLFIKVGQFRYFSEKDISYGNEKFKSKHKTEIHAVLKTDL